MDSRQPLGLSSLPHATGEPFTAFEAKLAAEAPEMQQSLPLAEPCVRGLECRVIRARHPGVAVAPAGRFANLAQHHAQRGGKIMRLGDRVGERLQKPKLARELL